MASCMAFVGYLWFTSKECFQYMLMYLSIPQVIRKVYNHSLQSYEALKVIVNLSSYIIYVGVVGNLLN